MVEASLYRERLYQKVKAFFLPATFSIVLLQLICYLIQDYTDNSDVSRFWATRDAPWYEFWRNITYGFLHASYMHLISNVAMTLVLAPTLEFIHGPFALIFVWSSGVFIGAYGHIIENDHVAVVGSSAGVYAILVARLWDVVVNSENMKTWPLQLLTLFCLGLPGLVDWLTTDQYTSTSHAAHLGGAFAGIVAAVICIRKLRRQAYTGTYLPTIRTKRSDAWQRLWRP